MVQIGFYNDSYVSSVATQYNDPGYGQKFEFTLTSAVDGFFGVDFYNPRMYPVGCRSTNSYAYMQVYLDGTYVTATWVEDSDNYSFIRRTWLPGHYTILISMINWDANDVQDFSFRTFLPVSVPITLTTFNSSADQTTALANLDFAASLKQPFTNSAGSGVTYKWNFS